LRRLNGVDVPHELNFGASLKWTAVPLATNYVLAGSTDLFFLGSIELYKGPKTEFLVLTGLGPRHRHFQVKAENDVLNVESPWSNVVTPVATATLTRSPLDLWLQPPKLEVCVFDDYSLTPFAARRIKWSSVPGAVGYMLQSSSTESFSEHHVAYRGDKTDYVYLRKFAAPYYRVRAIGISPDNTSPWSNVVKAP
jgi:hypothetical protein